MSSVPVFRSFSDNAIQRLRFRSLNQNHRLSIDDDSCTCHTSFGPATNDDSNSGDEGGAMYEGVLY